MNAIETRGLRKVYPGPSQKRKRGVQPPTGNGTGRLPTGDVVALDALDLDVHDGEFFGIIGPNGAGKTTTIVILTTRVKPTAGTAMVAGVDVCAHEVQVRQRIGVVPQRPNPDRSLNAMENLVFHAAYFGIPRRTATERARQLLDQLEIGSKAEAKVDEMSGGQQQRLMIARALIHEPEIIFLDEPTVGLDPNARQGLWAILRDLHSQGRTIIMTTHYMDEADQLSDRIALIDRGKLLALDTPANLKARTPDGSLETFFMSLAGRGLD